MIIVNHGQFVLGHKEAYNGIGVRDESKPSSAKRNKKSGSNLRTLQKERMKLMPLTSFDDLLREQLEEDTQVARLYEQECRSLDAAVAVNPLHLSPEKRHRPTTSM